MSSANTPTIGPLDPRDSSPLPLEPGDVVANRYEVLRLLGSGGSAHVYAVRDRRIGDEIALKLLRGDVDVARSRREAEFARGSSSDRLVRAFDLVEADGLVFLTMELVSGGSLRDRLRREPLPIEEVIRLAGEILEGLAALHTLDIVHRDVKPGNLLLTTDGHIKISDFGIARRWTDDEARLTVTGATLGTVDYLSPEQASGIDVDPRSDLYSFGVVLYEMLTGRLPFEAPSKVAAIGMRLQRRPTDVRALRPDTPRWLAAIVARLLETKREDRYPSAEAALRDLRRRRVRIARLRPHTVALLAILAVVAGIWLFMRPTAVRLAADGEWGLRALDANDRVVWARSDTRPAQAAIVRRGDTTEVAAVLAPSALQASHPSHYQRLSFLDARRNRVLRSVTLPSAAWRFPDYSDRYGVAVRSIDVDGDGTDEVLVAYGHHYYPWFLVLHDLRRGESRVVFVASGQHRIAGIADVDGDGTAELILVGIANRLGWYSSVAAVRMLDRAVAHTPDRDDTPTNPAMVWYALCPAGKLDREGVTVDSEAGVIRLPYDHTTVELRFDGFINGSSLAGSERKSARERAYHHLREAKRFIEGQYAAVAVQQAETARQLAIRAADPTLVEWCERVKGIALVHAGRFDEATKLFTAICDRSDARSDTAYDAGTAFHVMGELEHAVRWYRRSVGREGQWWVGRIKYEALQGLVLALGEMGRWNEALRELDTYAALYKAPEDAAHYREYVRWRSGGVPRVAYVPHAIDPYRFIGLESELARGVDPRKILRKIEDELQIASETRRLVLLTKAEALRRAGRPQEAFASARSAYEQLYAHRRTSALDHAHLSLAEERTKRIAAELRVVWHPNRMSR